MISYKEAWEIAQADRDNLKLRNQISFSDMERIPAPDIDVFDDSDCFFNHDENKIHLGIRCIVDNLLIEDELDLYNGIEYIRGHEEQHRRSTARKPYNLGMYRAVCRILEYISAKEEPTKRRFRAESDYEDFANRVLPGMGIYVNWNMLGNMVGVLFNCIEDGRIERIRSLRFPGFEKQRLIYRGRAWLTADDLPDWTKTKKNPALKLGIIFQQILSLATVQVYSRGFAELYTGTPVMEIVQKLNPLIAKGYLAARSRDMATASEEIAKQLAPVLYEACKMSATEHEVRKALDELIKQFIQMHMNQNSSVDISEKDEDTDEGKPNCALGQSDLSVTVDDETFDKMQESMSDKEKASGNLVVKREHPKESKDGKGDSAEKNDDGESNNGNSSEQAENSESGNESHAENGKPDHSKTNKSKPDKFENHQKGTQKGKEEIGKVDTDALRSEMKQAAEEMKEMTRAQVDLIAMNSSHVNAAADASVVPDTSKTLTSEDVSDCLDGWTDFEEVKREYKLTEKLPPVLAARGRTLLRKNQKYFRSLSTPNVTYLDSGAVDPSRIYGLAMGDNEIFRKKGIDNVFDGCAYILIDNSGSMSGNKRTEACKAAAVIEESFRGLIPIKIVAFDVEGGIVHEVVKGWDEQQKLNCCWNFCLQGRQGAGNEDGYDIKIATKELMAYPRRKKLLIVLSDGAPGDCGLVKKAVSDARKKGIQVNGIYFEEGRIGSDAEQFKRMYERDYICCQLSEVDQHLEHIMKKFSRS